MAGISISLLARRLSLKAPVRGAARIVLGMMQDKGVDPFRKATAETSTGFALGIIARATGADRAVVQCLTGPNVVRKSEDQQAVIHQDDLQRKAREFAAAG